ncbi:MAG: cobalamin B12-binding domain-containing protein [Candidatus Caldatribacteriaceae bacterium]
MSQKLEHLAKKAQEELHVSQEATSAYEKTKEILLHMVNEKLTEHPHLAELLGSSPLQMMYDNHHNHINFMINVLKLNGFEMLTRIVPWVYRTYHMRGFSYEYFPEELKAWQSAVEKVLDKKSAEEIIPVYEWLLKNHEVMISLSKEAPLFRLQASPEWQGAKEQFLRYLLNGDFDSRLKMSKRMVRSEKDLKSFYLEVVQPSLYDIGALWEEGQINVAEEHLATAIVGRIMANIYARIPRKTKK